MKRKEKLLNFLPLMLMIVVCFLSVSIGQSQTALTKALDYDGDGRADAAIFRSDGNTWQMLRSNIGPTTVPFGIAALDTLTPGDFDGDAKGDISVWRASDGTFYYLKSSNGTYVITQFGQASDEPVARDYDGDGRTDFAVVRRENGYLYWYILQSSNNVWYVDQYGINTDRPAPGDYDGDGRFDLAVQRRINDSLVFYVYRSSLGALSLQWGIYSDLAVPGDYDGDGATDIAVCRWEFRQGDKYEWWIHYSSDSSFGRFEYGRADLGDIIVQADYDGDGKTDMAVWRSPEQNFWVNQSSNGQTTVLHWGFKGDLPVASYDTH